MFESNFNTFLIFHVLPSQGLLKGPNKISIPDQGHSSVIQCTPVNCSTSPPTRGFLFVHILPLNNLMAQVLEIISKYGLTFASISYNKPKMDYFLPITSQFWFILSLIIVATIY